MNACSSGRPGTSLFGGGGPVFSEYHVEQVRAPCFMVRQGRFKEVYVHGHDSRRFDRAADPGDREPERNGTTWDYTPTFDATKAYVR